MSYTLSLLLLYANLMGGGNDLLDYLPTSAYWQGRNVPVTVDAMLRELQPAPPVDVTKPLADLGSGDHHVRQAAAERIAAAGPAALPGLRQAARSDDPETAARARELIARLAATQEADGVRRLMAVRTLGELRAKEALPALQGLARSDELFVADYARAAVAAIEGKPSARERAAWVDRDVWFLPGDVRAVLCFAPKIARPVPIHEALREAKLPAGTTADGLAAASAAYVAGIAEQAGNLRFDGLTVGVSGDVGDKSGYVVAMLRGRYDRAAAAGLFEAWKVPSRAVAGTQIFLPTQETAVFFPSNDRVVLLASPQGRALPVEEVITSVRNNGGSLRTNQEIIRLVQSVDTTQPLWAVVKVTDAYRRFSPLPLAAFDTVTLVGRQTGPDSTEYQVQARGTDPAAVKQAADAVNAAIGRIHDDMKPGPRDPAHGATTLQQAAEAFVGQLRFAADGPVMAAKAGLTVSRADLLAFFIDWANLNKGPEGREPPR